MTANDEKRGYTDEDLADVSDSPEWTEADFAAARPARDMLPEAFFEARRRRGLGRKPAKVLISVRLSPELIERLAADGPDWRGQIDALLKKAVGF